MHEYSWAVNKWKVITAITQLQDEQLRDPKVVIDEESIKARYVKLAGLLAEDAPVAEAPVTQRVVRDKATGVRKTK